MNCREWEERIAGDLDDPGVARHLADCAGCQEFADGLRKTLGILQAAHAEPVAPAHFAAVRARVIAELRPRRRWGWVWAAAAMAIVLGAVVGVIRRPTRVEQMPVVVRVAPPPAPPLPPAPAERVTRRAHEVAKATRKRVAPRPKAGTEEVLVKVETDDPDVVIYWIAETKGQN